MVLDTCANTNTNTNTKVIFYKFEEDLTKIGGFRHVCGLLRFGRLQPPSLANASSHLKDDDDTLSYDDDTLSLHSIFKLSPQNEHSIHHQPAWL